PESGTHMSEHLQSAARSLREHYGSQSLPGRPGTWETLVKLIIGKDLNRSRLESIWNEIRETPLRSATETETLKVAEIEEILEQIGRPVRPAKILKELSRWWRQYHGENSEVPLGSADADSSKLEEWRTELRQIRGLGAEQADRILLFAANCPTYPVDRSSVRI